MGAIGLGFTSKGTSCNVRLSAELLIKQGEVVVVVALTLTDFNCSADSAMRGKVGFTVEVVLLPVLSVQVQL